jgi:hypothetical protein
VFKDGTYTIRIGEGQRLRVVEGVESVRSENSGKLDVTL